MDKINDKEQLEMFMRANNISKEEVKFWKSIAKMSNDMSNKINEILKEFNDKELGGGYLYFLYNNELIQMDLVDYSCISVCKLENIKDIEFIGDVESILITTDVKECDTIWIDEMCDRETLFNTKPSVTVRISHTSDGK